MKKIKNWEKMKCYVFLTLTIICAVSLLTWATVRIVKGVQFDLNCHAYIHRAAGAINIETAKEELEKAIAYMEEKGLTEGTVSIFFKNPKNDIGYWYHTIKGTHEELAALPTDITQLEKSNYLMRMHESFEEVGLPDGISIYPHNPLYFGWSIISLIGAIVFWHLYVLEKNYWW